MSETTNNELQNPKHELFCLEYLKDFNATQAAVRAGYSTISARSTASKLLKTEVVKTRIAELQKERLQAARIDASYVLNRLLIIDRLNVKDLLDDDGDLKDVKDWSEDWQTSIQALDIQVSTAGGVRTLTKKVKLPDRLRNLEMLGKHIDISAFKDKDDGVPTAGQQPAIVVEVTTQQAKENVNELEKRLKG